MKFIVHIGMPKSGSTALQHGLSAMRDTLARQGMLYPTSPVISDTSNFLLAGVMPFDELSRHLKHSLAKCKQAYQTVYHSWTRQIRASAEAIGAHTVILSGESLYGICRAETAARLQTELRALGASAIEIVVYVRQPSDWYLSAAQQDLRASHLVRQAGPVHYRKVIETYAGHVSPDVRVFEYNRARFSGGDILGHFLQNTLGIAAEPIAGEAERQLNGTISAEGMSILRDYRLINHQDDNSSFTRDTALFRRAIAEADQSVGGDQRPVLLPALKDRIDHGSPDILWLRDRFGITFPGIDYDRISNKSWDARPQKIEEICVVNKTRRLQVLNAAVFHLASAAIADRRAARAQATAPDVLKDPSPQPPQAAKAGHKPVKTGGGAAKNRRKARRLAKGAAAGT